MPHGTTVQNGTPPNPGLVQDMVAKKDHEAKGIYQMGSSLRRRLFAFSAGDKLSLKTRMADTGENEYLPFA